MSTNQNIKDEEVSEQETSSNLDKQASTIMAKKLGVVAVIMLAFGFAMIPLYSVFCEITGWNPTFNSQVALAVYTEQEADTSREIKVEFVTVNQNGMPWDFRPVQSTIMVNPGKEYEVGFTVKNRSKKRIVGQAIPSFSPARVSTYFNKTECFCFNQQTLASGESEEMPMKFFIDKDLPEKYETITLVYTLHNVTPASEATKSAD